MEKTESDRKSLNTVDLLLSTAIFGLGLLALVAAFGVPMDYIILIMHYFILIVTVGVESCDLLLIVQTKSGIESQLVEIGLATTLLLVKKKLPVILPNLEVYLPMSIRSYPFPSQAVVAKILLQTADYSKIHLISKDMESMLLSKSKVILEEPPYCFLSWIEKPNAELVLGCNLDYMSEEELVSMEQDVIHESGKII
ncbi:hypothetical protein Vadar_008213 [Vaccinium darrowii]|uniref:Uncharacterized protein n=1 Tax=Vaccinium darrowii TaxID=229202 RepID=A0ACB7ZI73_9ERIC|nr:hypothetical protein Vadar_008213 [Vaccinium darrowii]